MPTGGLRPVYLKVQLPKNTVQEKQKKNQPHSMNEQEHEAVACHIGVINPTKKKEKDHDVHRSRGMVIAPVLGKKCV